MCGFDKNKGLVSFCPKPKVNVVLLYTLRILYNKTLDAHAKARNNFIRKHKANLIKLIIYHYLKIRMRHKSHILSDVDAYIRRTLTKIIIFKNQ